MKISDDAFYPDLSEQGKKEAQEIIDMFKLQIKKVAEETIGQLYCDVAWHIQSDSWINFRNALLDGFKDYNNRAGAEYDFAAIRSKIYSDYSEEIIKDLNQDNLKEIDRLRLQIKHLEEMRRY